MEALLTLCRAEGAGDFEAGLVRGHQIEEIRIAIARVGRAEQAEATFVVRDRPAVFCVAPAHREGLLLIGIQVYYDQCSIAASGRVARSPTGEGLRRANRDTLDLEAGKVPEGWELVVD